MKTISLASILLLLPACDTGKKCVADCDSVGQGETGGGTDNDTGAEDSATTTGASPMCQSLQAEAGAFIGANQMCNTDDECTQVNALCYQGAGVQCGAVAVNTNADLDAWDALHDALGECDPEQCGGNPCGAGVLCIDGACTMVFPPPAETTGGAQSCEDAEAMLPEYLADNSECEQASDCLTLTAPCYLGPEKACNEVAVNRDADLTVWGDLYGIVDDCGDGCANEEVDCMAEVDCGPDNRCIAVEP